MKLLITASTFPRWDDDNVPRFVEDQAVAISRCIPSTEIHVLAPHHQDAPAMESRNGMTVHRFSYFWPARYQQLVYPSIIPNIKQTPLLMVQVPFLVLAEFLATWRLARELKPDFIYAHWFIPQGITAALAARLTGIPCVFTSHSSDVQIMAGIPLFGRLLVHSVLSRMRAITAVSRRSLEKMSTFFSEESWGQISRKIAVIPMGVDTRTLSSESEAAMSRKMNGDYSEKKVVLFVGRLAEKKGIPFLLRAFAHVGASEPDLRLIIAGDGPLEPELAVLSDELGIKEQTHFTGFVSGDEKSDLLLLADVMVVPSIITDTGDAEGLPVSLLEGMATGRVCIATDVSGADDILTDGQDGYIVPQKDVAALAESLAAALRLPDSEKSRIKTAARETAAQFDWGHIAEATCKHLFGTDSNS